MEAGMVVRDNMKSAYSFLKQVKLKKVQDESLVEWSSEDIIPEMNSSSMSSVS
jgi:hypothetical protein